MIDLFESYCAEVNGLVDRNELDKALGAIAKIAEAIARSEASLGRVFSSPTLDEICQRIGLQARSVRVSREATAGGRSNQGALQGSSARGDTSRRIIYVASELYASGGHTRLLENMIRLQPNRASFVLLTNPYDQDPAAIVPDFIAQATNNIEVGAIGSSYLDKLNWLQSKLEELAPDAIVLLNHHHDAVAIAAPDCKRIRTFFIHHADHKFTLGTQMAGAIHVDLQPNRYFACKRNGLADQRYWPATFPDLGVRVANSVQRGPSGLLTCTSGSQIKFIPRYEFSYFDEVANILARSGGRHIHIGPLDDANLLRITRGLASRGIPQERFVHVPFVRSVWKALAHQNVGLYIASFPIYSGGATLEALASGTPVLAHIHSFDSCFSDVPNLYPGCMAWRTREELYRAIETVDTDQLRRHAALGRDWYERHFRSENLIKCLDTIVEGDADMHPFIPPACEADPLAPFLANGRLEYSAYLKLALGAAFGELGLLAQADASFSDVMQLQHAVALAFSQAGNVKFAAKDFVSAKALFARAVNIAPDNPHYLNCLAGALFETGEIEPALSYLERALQLRPDFADAKRNRSLILQRRGNTES